MIDRKLTFALVATAVLLAAPAASAITLEEIKTLARIGVAPDEMIKAIERDKTVFRLQVSQILELKQAGIPDAVLKYMLKTPQLFGGTPGKPGVEPGKGPDKPEVKTPEELTPEERAAMEAKQRAKAEEAQRRAFAQGILANGMNLAKSGDCVPAIQTFLDFIQKGGYTKGSLEHYNAWYGIAFALTQCELYQSAANYLVEVLLEGPEKPFFQQAFWDLRKIRKRINYSPPDLERLTGFPVVSFSRRFQDEYNYVLGEFFYDYSNFSRALTYFEQVSADSPDYGKSTYLTGLVQVQNNLYRSAVQSFQSAITATEKNKSDSDVKDLSYLALARIAYEAENFDAAIFYYRKIGARSNKLPTAFYEAAWTYFVKGDYSRALGTFHALHSPYFDHYFYPELWILEATAYVNMCHYEYAREALKQFNTRVNALAVPLKGLLNTLRTPVDFFNAMIKIAEGDKKTYQVDRRIVYPVLANVELYNLYKTIRQIESEEAILRKTGQPLGQFGQDLLAKLGNQRQSRVNEAGIKVQQILKQLEAELADYAVKVTEIEVDLAAEEIDRKTREIYGDDKKKGTPAGEKGGNAVIVGSDSMSWSFRGEWWRDEIGGFRSDLTSMCPKEQ